MLSKTKIVTYSHGIVIYPHDRRCREALRDYCHTLVQWEFVKKPPRWKPIRTMKRVFAGATRNRSEYRFHRTCLDEILKHLSAHGVRSSSIDMVDLPIPEGDKVEMPWTAHDMDPRDYQVGLIEYMANEEQPIKVTDLQTGRGKLQPLNSAIKVPGGWSTMGEMKVGTEVIAKDGTTTKVTAIYPQGEKQLYRVTFADGRSTEAGAEHLWKVYYVNTVKHRRWRIVDTIEMLRLISMPNPRVYVPLIDSEKNPDIELPIPPYTLGAILGDGCISNGTIVITKPDIELSENIQRELDNSLKISHVKVQNHKCPCFSIIPKTMGSHNVYRDKLKEMDLMGKVSHTKFIPDVYLNGSTEQRLALLQGLMDTDGTVNQKYSGGSISFCSTSADLARGVQYLVRSLGGIASISLRFPKFTYKGDKKAGRKAYQVNIRYHTPSELFRISRKVARTNDDNQYAKGLKLQVKSIEPSRMAEAQCISIDHPDRLYVTDDFIVTHNTFIALNAMVRIGKRTVIQLRGGYVSRWMDDLKGLFNFKKGELLVVRGRDSLQSIINLAKNDDLDAKCILITNKTLYNFFVAHEEDPDDNIYGIAPEELYELLGVGLRIVDEVHEDYHLNFRTDIYSNVKSSIHLSATLDTEDPFRRRMYDIALPQDCWYKGIEYDKYIQSYALFYNTNDVSKIKTSEKGQDSYSHGAFEKSVLRDKKMLDNYLEIIRHPIQEFYIEDDWQGGQKCIVFCYLVEFCEVLKKHLKKYYPELTILEYVAATDAEVLKRADIIISTIKSAGTAQDIPDLKVSVMSTAVRKKEANIQTLGRLRKLKRWPDITPVFCYLNNTSIETHMKYHEAKKEIFQNLVLSQKVGHIPIKL